MTEWIRKYRLPLALAVCKFILPFLLQNGDYELHRDEYLYLAEAGHLSWGFMEVPPLLSFLAWISSIFGNGFFWVKFWPALFGALTVWTTCSIVRELGGDKFAQFLAGFCIICGVYLRIHFLFQPNFLEIYWWTLLAYLLVKYANTTSPKYLYWIGAVIGLSFLSKYSVLLFAAGIFAALLLTRLRSVFASRHIYIAAGIALLIMLPNIIWQYTHAWPVLYHMKELRQTQLVNVSSIEFLRDQFLMHLPSFFVWVAGLYFLFFDNRGKKYRFLAWIYLTVIILLLVTSGKSYYALGAYPMLFAAGSVAIEKWWVSRLTWMRYAIPAVVLAIFVFLIPILLPVWAPAKLAAYYQKLGGPVESSLVWEDMETHPLPQDFADMLGWKELTAGVEKTYAAIPDSLKSKTIVFCWNYGQAGALQYYGKGKLPVHTANASFLFWMPEKYQLRNMILVSEAGGEANNALTKHFYKVTLIDSVANSFAREAGTRITLLEGADPMLNSMLEMKIREQKDEFRR